MFVSRDDVHGEELPMAPKNQFGKDNLDCPVTTLICWNNLSRRFLQSSSDSELFQYGNLYSTEIMDLIEDLVRASLSVGLRIPPSIFRRIPRELACLGQHKPKAFTSTLLGQVRPRGISSDENTHVPGKYIKRFLHVPAPGVYREVLPNGGSLKPSPCITPALHIGREFVPHRALPYIYLPDIDKYGRRLTNLRRRNLQRDQLVVTFPGTSPMKSSSRGAIFPIFLQKSKDEFFKNRDKTGNLRSTLLPTLNSHWEFSQVVDASLQTPEN
ncbi:hypothetical protein LguiA_033710 [Lonicera macranthoides]